MSIRNDPRATTMAVYASSTISSTDAQLTLSSRTYEWPTLDTDHNPTPLVESTPIDTDETTLKDHLPAWVTLPEPVDSRRDGAGDADTTTDHPGEQFTLEFYERDAGDRICELYDQEYSLERIATIGDWELERVARALRHAGMLARHDDPRTLAHLYHDYDHSIAEIARRAFGDAVCPETVRRRMEWYDIERENRHAGTHYESLLQAATEGGSA